MVTGTGDTSEIRSAVHQLLAALKEEQAERETTPACPGEAPTIETHDAWKLSDEVIDELGDRGEPIEESRVRALVQDLLSHRSPGGTPSGSQERPLEREILHVDWQPLAGENRVLEAGEAWGAVQVSREKKSILPGQDPLPGGENDTASPAAGGEEYALHGAGICPAGEQMASRGDRRLPMGTGGSLSWKLGDDAKPYLEDSLTGQRMEIPDHGELKAPHRMILKNYGKTGEVQRGEMLAWYETIQPS